MPKAKKVESSHMHLNLTAMLDVVFNLIFFFICITNFASGELPPLEVPKPDGSKALVIDQRKKMILNVVPEEGGTGRVKLVKVGGTSVPPGEEARLTVLLKQEFDINPELEIDLRVDKQVQYQFVQPVMKAITRAGISKINLVAQAPE